MSRSNNDRLFSCFSLPCVRGKKKTYPTFSDQKMGLTKKKLKKTVLSAEWVALALFILYAISFVVATEN
jgi:hypothetical protein